MDVRSARIKGRVSTTLGSLRRQVDRFGDSVRLAVGRRKRLGGSRPLCADSPREEVVEQPERAELLVLIGGGVALLAELVILEVGVLTVLVAGIKEGVAEDPGLRDGDPTVVDAVDKERRRVDVLDVGDRRAAGSSPPWRWCC